MFHEFMYEFGCTKVPDDVYSNSKMVAATRDANELKMLAWAVHLMKEHSCNVTASDPVAHCPVGWSQPG